jgi:hypothetical protein
MSENTDTFIKNLGLVEEDVCLGLRKQWQIEGNFNMLTMDVSDEQTLPFAYKLMFTSPHDGTRAVTLSKTHENAIKDLHLRMREDLARNLAVPQTFENPGDEDLSDDTGDEYWTEQMITKFWSEMVDDSELPYEYALYYLDMGREDAGWRIIPVANV